MHARYLKWLLIFCCLSLVPAMLLNVLLMTHASNIQQRSKDASAWQQRTRGITFTPTSGNNGMFKSLRLIDRMGDIDTVVLGSSTVMPIAGNMLPAGWRLYNFSQSGHPLKASIGEAEYLVDHAPQIRHYLITLDWALGFPYDEDIPIPADLSADAINRVLQTPAAGMTPLELMREALSYPRLTQLGKILSLVFKSSRPIDTFREYFFQDSSDDYLCVDGTPGRDFDIFDRGSCNGFRHDGSATYYGYTRVNNARQLLMAETASNSKYVRNLHKTGGRINERLLEHLARLNAKLKSRGGELTLILPPLLPGLELFFLQHPQYSVYLLATKNRLDEWARREQVLVFDAGQSERHGCASEEFLDAHHATPGCYQKVFKSFWQNIGGAGGMNQ